MDFPKHACSLTLQHNPQKCVYQNVRDWLADFDAEPRWASPEDRQKAIDTNEIWIIQWYPLTPIGFCDVAASTLEGVLALANT